MTMEVEPTATIGPATQGSSDGAAADKTSASPSDAARPGYTLALLVVIYIFAFIDRQIVNILAESLKNELDLQNWQLGILTGFAFAIFYSVLGLPLAAIADRGYRKKVITISVGVWSSFTILCGAAQNFPQLLAARIGVGIGEAGGTPASHSIISAIIPRSRRAMALSIYAMGVPIGTLLGMTIGGVTADLWGWRVAFLVAGLPGLVLCAVAALMLREPRRSVDSAPPVSMKAAFGEIGAKPSVRWAMTGIAMTTMVFFGQAAFTASFFQRVHGPQLLVFGQEFGLGPQGFVGATMGLAFGVGGLLGNLLGGPLGDRAARRNAGGYLVPPAIAALTLAPLGFACYIAPDVISSLLFLACGTTAGMMFYGPSFAALHSIVRPELRSSASALALMTLNLVGYGCGPLAVGIMTDVLADPMAMGQAEGLRWSLIGISVFGGPIAAFSFYRASRLMTVEQTQLGSVSN